MITSLVSFALRASPVGMTVVALGLLWLLWWVTRYAIRGTDAERADAQHVLALLLRRDREDKKRRKEKQ